MGENMNDERVQRYADAAAAAWDSGEFPVSDAIARAAIALADAEQAELTLRLSEAIHFQDVERAKRREAEAEVENLRTTVDFDLIYQRGLEAKVARVGPFLDYIEEMWDGCEPGRGCTGCEVKQKVAYLRAALDGPTTTS